MTAAIAFPSDYFVISDDDEAREILLRLGILDKMVNPASFPDGHTSFLGHKQHPTHWILAARFSGCENPNDDGFVVQGWLKSKWPVSIMKDHVQKCFGDAPDNTIAVRTYKKGDIQKN